MNEHDELLIARYLDGRANAADIEQINARIAADSAFRTELIRTSRQDAYLRELLQVRAEQSALPDAATGGKVIAADNRFRRRRWWIAAAAALLCAAGMWWLYGRGSQALEIARAVQVANAQLAVERDGVRLPLTADFAILNGDRIDASATPLTAVSVATVRYPDGTEVRIVAGTQLRLTADADGKRVDVTTGGAHSEVTPQPAGRPMRFTSRFGQATVVGTRLSYQVDAAGARLEVTAGQVELRRAVDGGTAMVHGGQFAVATATADTALIAQPLPTVGSPVDGKTEDFESSPVGQPPACAAGPEKLRWNVAAIAGNQFAEVDSTELAELEISLEHLANYTVDCRFWTDSPTVSLGVYTPYYGFTEKTWGLELRGTDFFLLTGKTNPTAIGTAGRQADRQLPGIVRGQWHRLHLKVDGHKLWAEVDGQPLVVGEPDFMHPGVWRFCVKGGQARFDDLQVANIPH